MSGKAARSTANTFQETKQLAERANVKNFVFGPTADVVSCAVGQARVGRASPREARPEHGREEQRALRGGRAPFIGKPGVSSPSRARGFPSFLKRRS